MTEVKFLREGGVCALIARGHATGSREVCAAVSAIVYTLAGYLENKHARGTSYSLADGCAIVSADDTRKAREGFRMAAIGLEQMASGYGEYLAVKSAEKFL